MFRVPPCPCVVVGVLWACQVVILEIRVHIPVAVVFLLRPVGSVWDFCVPALAGSPGLELGLPLDLHFFHDCVDRFHALEVGFSRCQPFHSCPFCASVSPGEISLHSLFCND